MECGTALLADAKFCLECGNAVATNEGTVRRSAQRSETRKIVTIVFVDLAGSTSLQEHMDPESVRRVMERFYATMRTEIEAAGGIVVKFTGDGVMAGFGIREAREDDALRAVRAAVAMQDSFGAFAAELEAERNAHVVLRIGINTGEVVVSEADDDVLGDVVNVAARLEHAAGDGNILIGDDTWKLVRHRVTCEAVAPLELKGKARPVPAHLVRSLERPTEDGVAAPFVGRGNELEKLRHAFERCVAANAPSHIAIVGSPGLGKTRIATEFSSSVAERTWILEARCEAVGSATYAPIADAIREAASIVDTAAPDDVVESIERLLPDGFPERERVARLAASLLGVGEAATPQETFWAVRRLLEGLALTRPLIVVVDDVQWAEPLMLDLLEHVVEWSKDAAIFIVALARPEIRELRPALVDGAIVLEALDPEDTATLALSLLGAHDLPAGLVRRILATTEGNPLFVGELLRMLVDDGVLHRDGDRWVVTLEADEIDVPPTIHALLAARIERLREDERAVVERASIVGQEFYRGAVVELVPPAIRPGIDSSLETLQRKELVESHGSYWIDERVFRFHHVLIRDAAYRRLLKEARAELHERFADWLEAKVGDLVGEHDEVLGYHLEQAHAYLDDLGPVDEHGLELGRRASAHLASATRRALDRDDLAAAANLSGRALALATDDVVRAAILLDRCEALLAMGDVGAAAEAVADLRRLASDERLRAWADCFDGQLAILTDPARLRETAALVEEAARRLEGLKDSAGGAKGHAVHAQALAHLGQFGACEAALDRALAAARAAGDRRRANAVLSSAPLAALWGPSPVPRASGRCLDVVRVLRITAGAPAVEATALRCQAVLEAMRGRADAAHRMLASARKTLEELGLRHALVECDLFAGLIDLFANDPSSAEASFRRAYEGFRALNVGTDNAQAAALLARALVAQGNEDEALTLTEESERLGGDDLKTAIAWRTVRARVLARRGEFEPAIELARSAVSLAEATDALVDHADACLALSEVLAAAGRHEEARAESRAGAELYARKEATTVVAESLESLSADREPASTTHDHAGDGVTIRAAPGVHAPEGVAHAGRFIRAMRRGDWDAMAAELTEDYVYVDRRSGLRSERVGRDAFVEFSREMTQGMVALAGITEWRLPTWDVEVLARWSDDMGLSQVRHAGDGWETEYLTVTVRRDGKATRKEDFDVEDHGSALARLDELSYELSPMRVAVERHLSGDEERGRTEVVGIVAGGNAALVRAEGSFVVVTVEDGVVTGAESFADDELSARRRLHKLVPSPSLIRWVIERYVDAHNARDWDRMRRVLGLGYTLHDHRPLGWGRLDVDGLIEHLEEATRAAASSKVAVEKWIGLGPSVCGYVLGWSGTTADGASFSYPRIIVVADAPSGTFSADLFELDQIDDARRLMAGNVPEGSAVQGGVRAAPGVDGRSAVTLLSRYRNALMSRRWDEMAAIYAPDHVLVDRRSGLLSELVGGRAWTDAIRAMWQGIASEWDFEIVAAWSERLHLARVRSWGPGWERSYLLLVVMDDDVAHARRTEIFDEDDHPVALRRLDELAYEVSAAKRAIDAYLSAPNERGWTDVVGVVSSGNAAVVRADGSFAVVTVQDDIVTGVESFGDDELSARKRQHELAPSTSFVSWFVVHHFDRLGHQDWGEIRTHISPDFVLVDHRQVGWGEVRGFDAVLEYLQEGARTASMEPGGVRVTEWLAITSDAALVRYRWSGTNSEGVDFGLDRLMLLRVTGGVGVHTDVFNPDQIDDARRRMERPPLVLGPVTSGYQRILNFREWDRALEFFGPDYVVFDHRLAGFGRRSLEELIDGMKVWVDRAPNAYVDAEPLHTSPGAEVAILHVRGDTREGAAFEIDIGAATRVVDAIGVSAITFEPHAVEAAIRWASDHSIGFEREEFDALHRETSGRHPVVSAVQRIVALGNAGDWAAVADAIAPGVVYEDHRPDLRASTRGRDAVVEAVRYQLRDGGTLELEVLEDGGPHLVLLRVLKRLGPSGASQIPLLIIYGLDDTGRLSHCHLFAEDELHAARDRLDTIAQPSHLVGAAFNRVARGYKAREAEAVADAYAADLTYVDHVHGETLDHAACVQTIRRIIDSTVGNEVTWEPVIWLGSRHGVLRATWKWDRIEGRSGWSQLGAGQNTWVFAVRVNQKGRIRVNEQFAPELMHKALARAEELYLEDEATGKAALGARRRIGLWRLPDLQNEGDWDGFAASLAADIVLVDHRHVGWGEIHGRDAVVAAIKAIGARSLQHIWSISDVHAVTDDGCVYTLPTEGIDKDGGRYEQGGLCITMLSEIGMTRTEVFALDRLDQAMERFQELRRETSRTPPATTVEWFNRVLACLRAGDLQGYGALWTEDVVHEEKRPQLRSVATGRQAAIDSLLHVRDLAAMHVHTELIATRGDRLELRLVRYIGEDTGGGTFDVPILQLHVMNEGGLVGHASLFEPDDVVAALEELDDRFEATLSPAQLDVWRTGAMLNKAYNAHDWDRLMAAYAANLAVVDHRLAGFGAPDADRFWELARGFADLVPDVTVLTATVEAVTDAGLTFTASFRGTDTNGSAVELTYIVTWARRDEMLAHWEIFPLNGRDVAVARLHELSRAADNHREGADHRLRELAYASQTVIEQVWDRLLDTLNDRDFERFDELHAPGFRQVWREWHLEFDLDGLRAHLEQALSTSSRVRRARSFVLDDRHGLFEMTWSIDPFGPVGESVTGSWIVFRLDREERIALTELFATQPGGLLLALERLEELYLEDEAAGDDALRSEQRLGMWRVLNALNGGADPAALAEQFRFELVQIDHRPAGAGELRGNDAWTAWQNELVGATRDRLWDVRSVRLERSVVWLDMAITGTNEGGGPFEIPFIRITALGRGLAELYAPEQRGEAELRFAELVDGSR